MLCFCALCCVRPIYFQIEHKTKTKQQKATTITKREIYEGNMFHGSVFSHVVLTETALMQFSIPIQIVLLFYFLNAFCFHINETETINIRNKMY